ncbi:helix-turn-helix transcriptional regulator [Actinomadura sp. NEAU-AAG7]|uniref:helix-turn-helix domain-containing protein n=1 Tax=Actinomadura sp. NEAU-AAG7 TaxID=2839640 RepID=UPI001BE47BA6|nr:helix-turn-helix transcriptional regulator [Actinomadura sp. NEAU-AAG7]MBT2207479.1 ArsR family transcriptional regulator [Actinomadura sp. NEAU-AAG7]
MVTTDRKAPPEDPAAVRVLCALEGGRVLPVSAISADSGIPVAAVRGRLRELGDAGLVTKVRHGDYRYYRLSGPGAAAIAGRRAGTPPPASLRVGTRAYAFRQARSCYGHLAGRLGCALTGSLIEAGHLAGHDGTVDLERLGAARTVAGALDPIGYALTASGAALFRGLGVRPPVDRAVRCCVDWSEQRHHVAGSVGRLLLARFVNLGWLVPGGPRRVLAVTAEGRRAFASRFGVETPVG